MHIMCILAIIYYTHTLISLIRLIFWDIPYCFLNLHFSRIRTEITSFTSFFSGYYYIYKTFFLCLNANDSFLFMYYLSILTDLDQFRKCSVSSSRYQFLFIICIYIMLLLVITEFALQSHIDTSYTASKKIKIKI